MFDASTKRGGTCARFLLGTALALLLSLPGHAQETIGGGTVSSPAVGPAPAYGIGGPNMVLVKNWHFGTDGTITNQADLNANFQYHDQHNSIANGSNAYGALIVAPDDANAIFPGDVYYYDDDGTHQGRGLGTGQPIEGRDSAPVRQFTTDSIKTFLTPLSHASTYVNGVLTVLPDRHEVGCGSFMPKWMLPNGGSLLGQDIVWETKVRYVTPPYFWFSLWTDGNQWNNGAEHDLIESYGEDYASEGAGTGYGNNNFDGHLWHANSVNGADTVNYFTGGWWGQAMAQQGITSYDASQYHVWTWVYKKDNSYAMYVDGVLVQSGTGYNWTVGNTPGGTPINMDFRFDASWGHLSVKQVDKPLAASALAGAYYEFNYSRVYLSSPESPYNGPHAIPGTIQSEDYDTGGEGVAYHVSSSSNGGQSGYRADNNGNVHSGAGPSGNNYALGWSYTGDWYRYTVSVGSAGRYTAAFQVSSAGTGGTFHLEDEAGNNLSGSLTVPNTGGWGNWQTVTSPSFALGAGTHTLRLVEDANGPSAWVGDFDWISLASAMPTASAAFVKTDTTTQGSWKGVYGADGFVIANDSTSLPAYASASTNAWGYTWNPSTSDARALQKGASGSTDRIAAQWGGSPTFDIDCNLTDGNLHQVALYGLDWDYGSRNETVQVVDAGTGTVLDSRNLTSFTNGIYLVWNVKGHVRFHVVLNGGSNLALSGLFFSPVGTGALITGTEFDDGAGPWGGNQANAAPAAFDGNVGTFYDCANSAGYVGIDAGMPTVVSKIVYAPRPGWAGRMLSGVFEGSNTSATGGYVTLTAVPGVPTEGLTNTLTVTDTTPYRWLRYRDAGSGNCDVAEVQFIDPPAGAPAKPTGLAAAPGNARVVLSWAASAGATSYHVLRSTSSGYAGAQAVAVNVTSTGYTDTGAVNGTTYYYQVTAVNANGHSGASAAVSARPVAPPAAPTGLTATPGAAGSKTITVSWTAASGATSYTVSRATSSGGTYTPIGTPTATSYASTGLTAGTTYFYKVSATNAGGTSGAAGLASAKAP